MRARQGFTLIELMLVVAILGILAAVAIPKFGKLMRKSIESASKGKLGALRGAIAIYYSDMEGQYPGDPVSLTVGGKYLNVIPKANAPNYHADNPAILVGNETDGVQETGGWLYDGEPADNRYGSIFVDCSHTDTKGSSWDSY